MNDNLKFEEKKLGLEEEWRRKTYIWSIVSGILTSVVAVTVALIAVSTKPDQASIPEITAGPVQACRDSLRRLETLSTSVSTQTVTSLSNAVRVHNEQCDHVLVNILEELKK